MDTEFVDRQQAIKLRLARHSVDEICRLSGRLFPRMFPDLVVPLSHHGPIGLFELTRANIQPSRISPELERAIVNIRQCPASQVHPANRYNLVGIIAILAELQAQHLRPSPGLSTIEWVLRRNGITLPRGRLTPFPANPTYPTPLVEETNQLHQVDGVGPIHLTWQSPRLLHLRWHRLHRWRRLPAILPISQGREYPGLLARALEKPRPPPQVKSDNTHEVVDYDRLTAHRARNNRLSTTRGKHVMQRRPKQNPRCDH